jgi:hypothetical protein
MKKIVDSNQRNWHLKLTKALWASRTTSMDNTWISPYLLVYGKEDKMPIRLDLNALIYVVNTEDAKDISPIQKRINQLLKLEEE